ncbi:class A beta-lactamase [Cupriavidus sp. 2TAF22]|uniref:class A beta-lactamase n=1 Tax=unclassified Cupriavidus TaxID=2640874 RepID=UPI003F8DBF1B
MLHFQRRRSLLLAAAAAPLAAISPVRAAAGHDASAAQATLAALEGDSGGRLGVAALNTSDGSRLRYRADERFAFCSTFKVMLAGAILARSTRQDGLLAQRIPYAKDNLVTYSPVTAKHAGEGMTVAELCRAALQYSDNTAANLLIRLAGGPQDVTAFARSIGDDAFRLDRWETELNTAIPGDPRDTSTPAAMADSLHKLALADALPAPARQQLQDWMRGNTTGARRIQAGMPAGWQSGDKTGTGDYGTTNDIAVLWPPGGAPVVVAVYFTQPQKDAKAREDVIAQAARIALGAVARSDVARG